MRIPVPVHRLIVPLALLAAACDDPAAPEAGAFEAGVPAADAAATTLDASTHWSDGYVLDGSPLADSVNLTGGAFSHNRSGGAVFVLKPAGTTGRWVVTFRGLSALLGGRSTVQVNAYTTGDGVYCKPVVGYLANDRVEVRCFDAVSRAAVNAGFILRVHGKYSDPAFAFAHQPTASDYAPSSAGSFNPAGTSRVYRDGVGQYRVLFNGLGTRLSSSVGGHVQISAVGTGKGHCKSYAFGGSPNLTVQVRCYGAGGGLADTKFSAMFTTPAGHLAYAWGDRPSTLSYTPPFAYASNPGTGGIYISRLAKGLYKVEYTGVDAQILAAGTMQATAYGQGNAQCQADDIGTEFTIVRCFSPSGALVDSQYMVLFAS